MERSFFFNAVVTGGVPDRTYSAEDFAMREACLISDGVIGATSLGVIGMSTSGVFVDSGAASVSGYTYLNTESLFLPLDAGHGTYDRIDTVALKLDLTARTITAVIVKGTPSAEPAAAVLKDTATVKYLPLADVLVTAGSSPLIESEDITDRRVLAGHATSKEELLFVLREYLGELDPVNRAEISQLRELIKTVSTDEEPHKVLCGDGVYREMPVIKRELAGEFAIPGTYTFSLEDAPSVDNMYDIEIQGAGGAGGSYNGIYARGGGGGGGAYLMVKGVQLTKEQCTVVVGHGGIGVGGGDGGDGGYSAFDGFVAEGGHGGKGGSAYEGGAGGRGMFCGEDGSDGSPTDGGEIYTYCGKGGYSKYGAGAFALPGRGAADGADADAVGAGGSGASCSTGAFDKRGGRGGHGTVVLYRYVQAGSEEAK